mgnify:CR=1 FL=1
MADAVIVSTARTPIGKLSGVFADLAATDLGEPCDQGCGRTNHQVRLTPQAAAAGDDLDQFPYGNGESIHFPIPCNQRSSHDWLPGVFLLGTSAIDFPNKAANRRICSANSAYW